MIGWWLGRCIFGFAEVKVGRGTCMASRRIGRLNGVERSGRNISGTVGREAA